MTTVKKSAVRSFFLFVWIALACGCSAPEREWQTTIEGALSASLSPDGQYALIGSMENGGALWRLQDNALLYNWNHASGGFSRLTASTFSRDSRYALTAEPERFVLWDVNTGQALGFWPSKAGILSLALSNEGRYALIGQDDYSAILIDTRNGSLLQTLNHSDDVNTVAISADGRIGATGSEDGIVKVWNLENGEVTFAYKLGDDVSAVALNDDGSLVFGTLYYGKGKIWRTESGEMVSEIGHNRTTITCARFSDDNKSLLTGFTTRRLVLWDVNSGDSLQNWRADPPLFWRPSGLVVEDVAFASDGDSVLNTFSNGSIYQWALNPARE